MVYDSVVATVQKLVLSLEFQLRQKIGESLANITGLATSFDFRAMGILLFPCKYFVDLVVVRSHVLTTYRWCLHHIVMACLLQNATILLHIATVQEYINLSHMVWIRFRTKHIFLQPPPPPPTTSLSFIAPWQKSKSIIFVNTS